MEKEYPKIQNTMDEAYKMFKPNWNLQDFWLRLNFQQRIAVFVGNLNYQVGNGGFLQWHDNGYSKCVNDLIQILKTVGNCEPVVKIIENVMIALRWNEIDKLNEFDSQFYKHAESMLDNVEKYLLAVA